MTGEIHVATQSLHDRVVTWDIGVCQPHGRDAAPDEVFLFLMQSFEVDSKFFMTGGHCICTEHIYLKFFNEASQQHLPFFLFQVNGNGFLADVGSHEIAVPVIAGNWSAYVAIGVAF